MELCIHPAVVVEYNAQEKMDKQIPLDLNGAGMQQI